MCRSFGYVFRGCRVSIRVSFSQVLVYFRVSFLRFWGKHFCLGYTFGYHFRLWYPFESNFNRGMALGDGIHTLKQLFYSLFTVFTCISPTNHWYRHFRIRYPFGYIFETGIHSGAFFETGIHSGLFLGPGIYLGIYFMIFGMHSGMFFAIFRYPFGSTFLPHGCTPVPNFSWRTPLPRDFQTVYY